MSKNNKDYDNVFKTLKKRHNRLFIPLINLAFGRNHPLDSKVSLLPTDGQFIVPGDEEVGIEERDSDMLLVIRSYRYLVECQAYDDDTMSFRIAEYSFIAARDTAEIDNGQVLFRMPEYVVIYVKPGPRTPEYTRICFEFPNGQRVEYNSKNVLISDYSREEIIEKELYALIPFYITRYETELSTEGDISKAEDDIAYFAGELSRLLKEGRLTAEEVTNLADLTNKLIIHITNGNKNEKGMVDIMGGHVIETATERFIRIGREQGIEQGIERGKDCVNTLNNKLIADGRIEDLNRSTTDKEYQKQLMREFGIIS